MFTVVLDESGDTGLVNVQPDPSHGPSQYFCTCATFFREENRSLIESKLKPLANSKGIVHANKMSHFEKIRACRVLAALPIGMVGVISNKLSLLGYLSEARKTPTHYYNKVLQYQLERIGAGMIGMKIKSSELRVQIEAREQKYSSLLAFVAKIQKNPLDRRATLLRNLDQFSISSEKKTDNLPMALSDIGANAIFCAVRRDPRAFGLSETRYLRELSPIFLSDKSGNIFGKGLKPIHSISDLALPEDTSASLASLKNTQKDYWRLGV